MQQERERDTHTQRERLRDRERQRERDRERETVRARETVRERDSQRERQSERERQTERPAKCMTILDTHISLRLHRSTKNSKTNPILINSHHSSKICDLLPREKVNQ